jgi:hypothetical protein
MSMPSTRRSNRRNRSPRTQGGVSRRAPPLRTVQIEAGSRSGRTRHVNLCEIHEQLSELSDLASIGMSSD